MTSASADAGRVSPRFRYEQVAEDLRRRIRSGGLAPGEQLAPEDTLARGYSITRQTLRKALALLEAEGAILRQKGRGTFVAESARPVQRAQLLYVGDYEGHFYKDLYTALVRECQGLGLGIGAYDPQLHDGSDGRHFGELLAGADLVLCADGRAGAVLATEEGRGCRLAFVGRHEAPGSPVVGYAVQPDELQAGLLAGRHLLALGHERIAFVGVWPERAEGQPFPRPVLRNRAYQGYRSALAEAGGLPERAYAYYGGVTEKSIAGLAAWLRHLDGWATAFICDADQRAVSLVHAATRLGLRVPADISVVGLANTPWAEATPPGLTSVSLREREMARLAARLCDFPVPDGRVVYRVSPRLVERASTAPPAG
jgi:DNA-binding LacI/PurR family transcriptional regulator